MFWPSIALRFGVGGPEYNFGHKRETQNFLNGKGANVHTHAKDSKVSLIYLAQHNQQAAEEAEAASGDQG
ncbi:MAG TPA: hypothetical protein DCR87_04710 [Acidobacteria bacterium]|nr:hypothetical protein [Acidobacteriota bacterium]